MNEISQLPPSEVNLKAVREVSMELDVLCEHIKM